MVRRLAAALEPYDPMFIEEPVLPEHNDALPAIRQSTTTPIATGERMYSRWDFKEVFETDAVDLIQPDVSHAGGITELKKIASMAEAYDVSVAPHCPLGPIALASCIQVDACTPNVLIQEQSLDIHYNETSDVLDYLADPTVFEYRDGFVDIPDGDGLGIKIDEEHVREQRGNVDWHNPSGGTTTALSRSGDPDADANAATRRKEMTRRHESPTEHAVPGRFAGETVIVTGSTRGIGAGVAERFAAEGANVVVSGRTAEAGEAVARRISEWTTDETTDDPQTGDATFVRADMRDPDDVAALAEAAAERYGSVDVLVNNAGVQTETAADEATLDDWAFVVETDFRAYWLAARAALEHMDRGAIVNISSNHAYATMPAHFPYNAVKAGINGMTRSLAVDFGPRVRVNTVVPGWVEIERTREELPEGRFEEVESIHPTGRIGTPSDVAGAVSFLASEDAAFVTGVRCLSTAVAEQ